MLSDSERGAQKGWGATGPFGDAVEVSWGATIKGPQSQEEAPIQVLLTFMVIFSILQCSPVE